MSYKSEELKVKNIFIFFVKRWRDPISIFVSGGLAYNVYVTHLSLFFWFIHLTHPNVHHHAFCTFCHKWTWHFWYHIALPFHSRQPNMKTSIKKMYRTEKGLHERLTRFYTSCKELVWLWREWRLSIFSNGHSRVKDRQTYEKEILYQCNTQSCPQLKMSWLPVKECYILLIHLMACHNTILEEAEPCLDQYLLLGDV